MRLLAPLLLLLAACAPTGVYRVERPAAYYTGYAVSATRLVGLLHGARVGEVVYVHTLWGVQRARVAVVLPDDACVFKGDPDPLALDVRKGDSGSAVTNERGDVVGVLSGRRLTSGVAQ